MATDLLYRFGCASKICSKCGEAKPRTEFNRERGKERAYCKACHGKSSRAWVAKNKAKRQTYAENWYQQNKHRYATYATKPFAEWPEWRQIKRKIYNRRR